MRSARSLPALLALVLCSAFSTQVQATTISPSCDGCGSHAASGCATCSGNFTTLSPAGATCVISKDASKAQLCGRGVYVVGFATTAGSYSSGTLTFSVKKSLGLDVSTARVRVLAKNSSSCDDMGDADQYSAQSGESTVDCGSWTDLGTVDVGSIGSKTLTIPNINSVIGNGYTRFLLVDASDYDTSSGQQTTTIYTNAATNSANRPVLTLN